MTTRPANGPKFCLIAVTVGALHGSLLFFFTSKFLLFLRFRSWWQCDLWPGPLCVCVSGSDMRRGDCLFVRVYQMFLLTKEKMREVSDYMLNMLLWRWWSEVFRGCAFDTCNVALVMFIFDVSMYSAVFKLGVGRPVRRPFFLQRSVCVFVGLHDTRLHLSHWHTVPPTAILGFGM